MAQKIDIRHEARKIALASLFSSIFIESDLKDRIDFSQEALEIQKSDNELAAKLTSGVEEKRGEIDKLIIENAPDWELDKIAKIDLAILRISIYEILHMKNTPQKVVIDEAVELAKQFGGDNSSKFVNGVLGSIVKKIKNKD